MRNPSNHIDGVTVLSQHTLATPLEWLQSRQLVGISWILSLVCDRPQASMLSCKPSINLCDLTFRRRYIWTLQDSDCLASQTVTPDQSLGGLVDWWASYWKKWENRKKKEKKFNFKYWDQIERYQVICWKDLCSNFIHKQNDTALTFANGIKTRRENVIFHKILVNKG